MNDFSISSIAAGLSQINSNNRETSSTTLDHSEFLSVASENFKNLEAARNMLVEEKNASQSISFWKNNLEPQEKMSSTEDIMKDKVRELMDKITSMLENRKDK